MIAELLYVVSLANELKIHCPEPVLQKQAADALDRWSTALDGSLKYSFVTDQNQASIRITFGAWRPNAFAETFKQGDPATGLLVSAFITFKKDIPEDLQHAVMVHEIGHVLGLEHDISLGEKPYDGPTMAPEGNRAQLTLHYLDVKRIRELYGLSPTSDRMDVVIFRKGRQIVWQPIQGDSYTQLMVNGKKTYRLPRKKAEVVISGNGYELKMTGFKLPRIRRDEVLRVSQAPTGVPNWIVGATKKESLPKEAVVFNRGQPDIVPPTPLTEPVPEF